VRPNAQKTKEGYEMLGVSTYGGGLWHTWFDRDLSLAGRVFVQKKASGAIEPHLVNLERTLLRIPSLAIHLDRSVTEGFKFNSETHLTPLLCESLKQDLPMSSLLTLVRTELELAEDDSILDYDLSLYDTQMPVLSGLSQEFLHAARLDNLLMSYSGLAALMAADLDTPFLNVLCLFDHEEVGSMSVVGADSHMLMEILGRLSPTLYFAPNLKKSFLISADVAHALHPNYAEKHESCHAPRMNHGLVIKYNPNQRYMTNGASAAYFKHLAASIKEEAANKTALILQEFLAKNDSPCGSTIGPFLASKTGILTIDVGIPILSMHSIREMMGVHDLSSTITLFTAFYSQAAALPHC
jgi:aspartyl aminopeptidase